MRHQQILGTGAIFYIILTTVLMCSVRPAAAETAMWGFTPSRNLVSDEKNVPEKWDAETGLNIKWTATLGSQTYAGPVIIGGKVFVGTNNQGKRNPKLTGDRGVIMAFRESDGEFLWQSTHTKLPAGTGQRLAPTGYLFNAFHRRRSALLYFQPC